MKREHRAALVTVVLIVGVLAALALRQPRDSARAEGKPSAVVFDLYQRAGRGDADGYLACLSPELRGTMESAQREMGRARFREHIATLGQSVKGVSVSEERVGKNEARLRVELVYADRAYNDVQSVTVVRRGGRWRIVSLSDAQPLRMPVPYGTPAYPVDPKAANGASVTAEADRAAPATSKAGG